MNRSIAVICLAFFITACNKAETITFKIPKDYRSWKKPVQKVLEGPVPGHGPTFRIIYGNNIAFNAVKSKDNTGRDAVIMPDGSVIIKEVYQKKNDIGEKDPMLTIMVKDTFNKNSQNGWLYYVKNPGKPVSLINSRMCIGCHEAANERHPYFDRNPNDIFRDYIFVNFIK